MTWNWIQNSREYAANFNNNDHTVKNRVLQTVNHRYLFWLDVLYCEVKPHSIPAQIDLNPLINVEWTKNAG